jgi:hypothetical protein
LFRIIAFFLSCLTALCLSGVASEQFPNSDIQWILDQYQVSEPVSLIPAEGLVGWTRTGGREIAAQSKWSNQGGKIVFERSERTNNFPGGDIVTAKQYTNFVLDFAWVTARGCNSGIKYRVKNFKEIDTDKTKWLGCEYQILDTANGGERSQDGRGTTASLYHVFAPDKEKKKLNPFGEVNYGRIVVLDTHIEHWLNGKKVLECKVGSEEWKKAVADSKFSIEESNVEGFGENVSGFILLQDHGGTIAFEKVVIREIGQKKN